MKVGTLTEEEANQYEILNLEFLQAAPHHSDELLNRRRSFWLTVLGRMKTTPEFHESCLRSAQGEDALVRRLKEAYGSDIDL